MSYEYAGSSFKYWLDYADAIVTDWLTAGGMNDAENCLEYLKERSIKDAVDNFKDEWQIEDEDILEYAANLFDELRTMGQQGVEDYLQG